MKKRRLSKRQRSWLRFMKNNNDWDWTYLMEVEYKKIQDIRNHLAEHKCFVGWEQTVNRMDITLRILKIILDESLVEKNYVNLRNVHRFTNPVRAKHIIEDANKPTPEKIFNHYFDVALAARNDLRNLKAWNLYFELRKHLTKEWWD